MAGSRNPYPALLVVAALPALVLGLVWKVADSRQPPAVNVSASGTPVIAPPVLSTPLLSVRRAPSILTREALGTQFKSALIPLLNTIDDSSCVDISIDGDPVGAKNENKSLRPAGDMMIVTAAVALDVLGADYRFTTLVQGQVDADGFVRGNLFLVGGGDPLLSSFWWNGPDTAHPPFNKTTIDELADLIVAAGVKHVYGAVVGDASKYDEEWYPSAWTTDQRVVGGGPVSALLVNDGRETATKVSSNPVIGAARVFTTLLEDRGVKVEGEPRSGRSSNTTTIATIQSNPLPLIIQEMLTTADVNTAEMLLKEIGIAAGGSGTLQAGLNVVIQKLGEWNVPLDGLWIVDGSGLSDANRMTCQALVAVLQHGSPTDAIGTGMPAGGQPGGLLDFDFATGSPLYGKIRAVTGTMFNYQDGVGGNPGAKTLSGYIPLADGRTIEFTMLLNGAQIAEQSVYRPVWELFASIMGTYLAVPTSTELGPR